MAIKIADEPPNFIVALCFNHIVCLPCSMCQEARIAKGASMQTKDVSSALHVMRR